MTKTNQASEALDQNHVTRLVASARRRAPLDARTLLERESDAVVAAVLEQLPVDQALRILSHMDEKKAALLSPTIHAQIGQQWSVNLGFDEDSVGRIMNPPTDAFQLDMRVSDLIEELRDSATERQIVYAFIVNSEMQLIGLVVLRDLLFAEPNQRLKQLMIANPFSFNAAESLDQAIQSALLRHYPMYPVCDAKGRLVGQLRGYELFEKRAVTLSAQTGKMVGVAKEERVTTSWRDALWLRQPWLQLNLLTAFLAGAVVGLFEDTIAQVVVLAVFLPVLAGQSGNTGCQALAVTLRGLTLNEFKPGMGRQLFAKEAMVGLGNGLLVGLTAALGMYFYAQLTGHEGALMLAAVVFVSMCGACVVSGVTGVAVPLVLRRFGADPVTASTIFLTTLTDVASMGLMLALATLVLI